MKKMISWLLVVLMIVILVPFVVLTGCKEEVAEEEVAEEEVAEEEVAEEEVAEEEEGYTFGFVFGIDDPFYTTMQASAQKKADELGIDMVFQTPREWSAEIQTPMVEALAARGDIDCIILVATDFEGMLPVAQRLYDQGISVLTVDGWLGDMDYTEGPDSFVLTHIGTDNLEFGRAVGVELAEIAGGEGKAYCMNSNPGLKSNQDRYNGAADFFAEEYPGIEVIGQDFCENDPDKAQQLARTFLEANPEVTLIWGVDVYASQGAAMAVENLGRDDITCAAMDATEFAIEKLREGLFNLVLAQLPNEMGVLAIESAYNYLESGIMPERRIKTDFVTFTEDNVDSPDMQQYIYGGSSE